MAKHDIVLLNTTSSGFETDLGSNVARIKGDADDLFSVRDGSGVDKFAVSSLDDSMIISGSLTLTGNLSSSLSSTASFGRIDVTNLVGDASQMTNTNEVGHVSSSKQLAARISGAFTAGFELDGENRVISGSATSTGSFTRVFANIYSGDASDMFGVDESGHFSGSAQLASNISGSFTSGFGLENSISGSATSTGSFGRFDILNSVTVSDASQVTGVADALPGGIISSSIPIASQISGAFTSGFPIIQDSVHGTGNIISHSAQPTGSVTASLVSKGFLLSGSVTATGSFGHFNMGDYGGFGTTSILSGSIESGARVAQATHGGKITILDTSELTGLATEGFISSSAQIAANISGAFQHGFGFGDPIGETTVFYGYPTYRDETHPTASINVISGSATSTGSFGRVDNISKIVADGTDTTGLSISTGTVSGSAQLATSISGSFNKGFTVGGDISGSATSTGSFSRLNFNSLSVTDVSGITGHEAGHVSGSSVIASQISASFQGGFNFSGTISGSSASALKIQSLNLGGTSNFANTNFTKNWDGTFVRTATFGDSISTAISGSFNAGFNVYGDISGSVSSTGSFSRIQSKRLFTTNITGERKLVSGSMDHDHYISGSFAMKASKPMIIPTFGRGHTVNTQQFTATSSMEDQEYRAQAGQLFVDNFGRLNMTVQTGSMVAVAGTWEQGPQTILTNAGGAATAGTRNAFIMGSPFTPAAGHSGSAIYDGIGWTRVSDSTGVHGSQQSNCSIGTVDAALFLRHTGGATPGTNTGKYGSFPNNPGHYTFMEFWDGIGYYRGATGGLVKRNGAGGKVGSVNSHITFGSDSPQCTVGWNGATWKVIGPDSSVSRKLGQGFGSEYSAVYAGGANPGAVSCTEEWNGTSWATATAMPTNTANGGGVGTQNAGGTFGSTYWAPGNQKLTQLYNGTSWSEEANMINNNANLSTHGTTGRGVGVTTGNTEFWTGGFVTGSADTHNDFSQNPSGRYLLTKKLQANYSPGCAGGGSTSTEEGGGY